MVSRMNHVIRCYFSVQSKSTHDNSVEVARNAATDNNAQRVLHWFVLCKTEMHLPHRWTSDWFICEETKRLKSDS